MSEVLLVIILVGVAFVVALALSEWAAAHWVRSKREQLTNREIPDGQDGQEWQDRS